MGEVRWAWVNGVSGRGKNVGIDRLNGVLNIVVFVASSEGL